MESLVWAKNKVRRWACYGAGKMKERTGFGKGFVVVKKAERRNPFPISPFIDGRWISQVCLNSSIVGMARNQLRSCQSLIHTPATTSDHFLFAKKLLFFACRPPYAKARSQHPSSFAKGQR
jgi:hypothetical protein